MDPVSPRPGDWFVVNPGSWVSTWIHVVSKIADGRKSPWAHAGVATRWAEIGGEKVLMIAEAMPGGAVEVPWHYQGHEHRWSCEKFGNHLLTGESARRYTRAGPWGPRGVPYSFLDYGALTAHTLHLPVPGLQHFIATDHHMICSQLVDQACLDSGWHLFDDNRWPGYVKPSDLGYLLEG
jgi:hypothetical protein